MGLRAREIEGKPVLPEDIKDPLDHAMVDKLLQMGGSGLLSKLAEWFSGNTRSALPALREAAATGDARSVESIAHSLKGSSGSMGARRMSAICAELQDAGASGGLPRVPG